MALITRQCASNGAFVTFTIDDLTMRVVRVDTDARSRDIKINLIDDQGRLAQEINHIKNVLSTTLLDFPAIQIQIERADRSIKSYVGLRFVTHF